MIQTQQPERAAAAHLLRSPVALTLLALGVAALAGALAAAVAEAAGAGAGMAAALAAPVLLLWLVCALRNYQLAGLAAVLVVPLAATALLPRQVAGLAGANPLNAVLLVLLAALLTTAALRPARVLLPAWPAPLWLYLAVLLGAGLHGVLHCAEVPDYFIVLGVLTDRSPAVYLQESLFKPGVTLLFVLALSILLRNAAHPGHYLAPLFCAALVVAAAVMAAAALSGEALAALATQESRGYLSRIGLHANELGLLLNMAAALALGCAWHSGGWRQRAGWHAVALALWLGVLLSFSRGAYLGALAVLAYLLFSRRNFRVLALAALLLPVAVLLLPAPVAERAAQGVQSKDVDAISSGRVREVWLPLLPELASRPLLGGGLGSITWSEAAKRRTILPVTHAHSAYLGLLLDTGVLGALVVALFLRHMWRLFRALARAAPSAMWRGFFHGACACVLLLLVQGVTDDSFLPTRGQSFLWLAYGIGLGLAARWRPQPAAAVALAASDSSGAAAAAAAAEAAEATHEHAAAAPAATAAPATAAGAPS